MAAKSLRTCPWCGHMYEVPIGAGHPPCPKCRRENNPQEAKTEAPSVGRPPAAVPGTPKAPPTPAAGSARAAAPARPAVSQRPVSTPPTSHFFRNLVGVIVGLVLAGVGLHYAGLLNLPRQVQEPLENLKRKVETAVTKPKEEDKKPVEKPPEEPIRKPPDQKPPEPKAPPKEPFPDFSKEKPFEVLKVEDGATIVVKGATKNITVHLLGVKVGQPGDAPIHGVRNGSETKDYVKGLLPKGSKIFLFYGMLDTPAWRMERDALGSDQAWVFIEKSGLFLNLELVKQGYARVEARGAKEFEELLRYWEEKAK
ncbi:MAG: hypothetical protein FD180_3926 [Planctomycetota bacterium]|nr:MAG: hypothetical protein FD180_3926 [Planctomycetota bacterium]